MITSQDDWQIDSLASSNLTTKRRQRMVLPRNFHPVEVKSHATRQSAGELLSRFETLEDVLQAMDDLEGKLGELLRNHATTARLCHTLIGLRTHLELETNLSELRYLPTDVQGRAN